MRGKKNTKSHLRGLLIVPLFLLLFLAGCDKTSDLERIKKSGELVIGTRNGPMTYYLDRDGPVGFEYSLAQMFAKHLGVKLKVESLDSTPSLFSTFSPAEQKKLGAVNLAAANLAITPLRKEQYRFGPTYAKVKLLLVYNQKFDKPRGLDDLKGPLVMLKGSNYEEFLKKNKAKYNLEYTELKEVDVADLLQIVNSGEKPYTLVGSDEWALSQYFFPKVKVAFKLTEQEIAWAFPPTTDSSLMNAVDEFFVKLKKGEKLKQLRERYYGSLDNLNYVGTKTYMIQVNQRLPRYIKQFKSIANKLKMDWRLLAAISYQESHWKPEAISPTGVRGMMMLTLNTAKEMQVTNRLDPMQSILGGGQYFLKIKKRFPETIKEPDLTWMALAAYNIGLGHVRDARALTKKLGGDPDKWIDVMESLPRLEHEKWYKNLRYGYVRGSGAVMYVQNIRRYHSILRWLTHPPSDVLTVDSSITPINNPSHNSVKQSRPIKVKGKVSP